MKSLNRVFLMGHLGESPELQTSKNGRPFTRLSLATNRSWMDDQEERQEATDWHSVFVFGPLAELCVANLNRGSLVFVEGSINQWKADGPLSRHSINAQTVKFLNRHLDNSQAARNHDAVVHPE